MKLDESAAPRAHFPDERRTVRRVLENGGWLALDHVLRLGTGFIVGAWVARHLGPERFGLLSFAVAFCAPFSALVSLGLNGLIVRDLVRFPGQEGAILGTAATIKMVGGVVALAACGITASLVGTVDRLAFSLVLITIAGTVFQAADVFELWFQGQGLARISAWVRSSAAIAISGAKIGMILCDAALPWFAAAGALELALCAGGWIGAFCRCRFASPWRFEGARAVQLLIECWPVAIAGLAVQIQAYFDQVLLASWRSTSEVGHYSAALRLVSIFAFLPMALHAAAAPEIARAHVADRSLYLRRMRDFYRLVLGTSLAAVVPLVLLPELAVRVVFGNGYAAAAAMLPLLALRLTLTALGVARSIFLTNEGILRHAMTTAIVAAVINLALNAALIPRWGAHGCIVAALVSFVFNFVLLEAFQSKARLNLRILGAAFGLRTLPK